jgi:hypothetical protein
LKENVDQATMNYKEAYINNATNKKCSANFQQIFGLNYNFLVRYQPFSEWDIEAL